MRKSRVRFPFGLTVRYSILCHLLERLELGLLRWREPLRFPCLAELDKLFVDGPPPQDLLAPDTPLQHQQVLLDPALRLPREPPNRVPKLLGLR